MTVQNSVLINSKKEGYLRMLKDIVGLRTPRGRKGF
jgi:hypothetical protein